MSFTAKEVKRAIEDNDLTIEFDGKTHDLNKAFESFWVELGEYPVTIGDFATTEPVVSERDDEYWVVVFKIGEQYFQVLGDYDSWNGTSWDFPEVQEVHPRQIVKTVYDLVK